MWRLRAFSSVSTVAFLGLLFLLDCQGAPPQKWEIVAENQSDVPCTISVVLGGGTFHDAQVDDLPKGKRWVLLAAVPKVIVRSAKVVRHQKVQEVMPNVEVPVGKRFQILVKADGKMTTSLEDQ